MKILMILASSFPPDSRVEKEAISLAEEGHEVHILCYLKQGQKKTEHTKHYKVHRLACSDFFVNKLSALALIIPSYFNKWKYEIEKLNDRYSFEAIHVHDLPLSKVGYYFKKSYGCKLICDQHEFYSDWIKKTAHMNTLQGRLAGLLSDWEKYERKYLNLADLVITVSEPLKENYIKKYGLDNNQIITIPNTPTKTIYNKSNINSKIVQEFNSYYIIFYAGGIDILRGIDTAIAALNKIKAEIPNVRLLLCGKIVKPYNPFKTAKAHKVEDLVIFKGWVDENDLPSYIAASNICFFTPPVNRDEINKTIATKVYQYAIMSKPVIVSDAKMMKEFVELNNLGISIQSDNADQFAEAVLKIYRDGMSINYRSSGLFFWEETVRPLCTSYLQLKDN
jgi:glycosyltransferase involved in cell wall biosynthesis